MTAESQGPSWALTVLKLYFSPIGRIRPPLYWAGLAGLAAAGLMVNALYGILFNGVAAYQAIALQSPGPGAGLELGALGLIWRGAPTGATITGGFVLAAFCVQAKRLHDAGRSAAWLVGFAVLQFVFPFVAGWTMFRLLDLTGFRWNLRYALACAAVGLGAPLLFKLWIGLLRSAPEANVHGAPPSGPYGVVRPPRRAGARRS